MQIQIINVTVSTVPTAKGSYQVADVAFKNLTFGGKVEGKKVMSFGAGAPSFTTLATAQAGETYTVNVVKNDKGYNDWVSMTKGGEIAAQTQQGAGLVKGGIALVGARTSMYETPEERAKKQVYIIRQSSASAAINALSVGAKTPLKPQEVIAYAKEIEAYVLAVGDDTQFEDIPDFPKEAE